MKITILCLFMCLAACYSQEQFKLKTDSKFQEECLSTSNNYRIAHGAPELIINKTLVNYSKTRCPDSSHESNNDNGENLYVKKRTKYILDSCMEIITSWYNESTNPGYKWTKPGYNKKTGHFTQLVWKGTTSVGCARCTTKEGKWYVTHAVCNYYPAGNIDSPADFKENVHAN